MDEQHARNGYGSRWPLQLRIHGAADPGDAACATGPGAAGWGAELDQPGLRSGLRRWRSRVGGSGAAGASLGAAGAVLDQKRGVAVGATQLPPAVSLVCRAVDG